MFKSRYSVSLISVLVGYAVIAAGLSVFGKQVARQHPGILTYFSFQSGAFAWSYRFSDGAAGPFKLGSEQASILQSARQCSCFYVYPGRANEPRKMMSSLNSTELAELEVSRHILLSRSSLGVPVVYELFFSQSKLNQVKASGSLFSGL